MNRHLFLSFLGCCGFVAACSLVVGSDPKGGVGVACEATEDCQGETAECLEGRCVLSCSADEDCPSGTKCAESICDLSFEVGFVYDGNATVSGFTRAHDEGRLAAKDALPWLGFSLVAQDIQKDEESAAISGLIDDGARAVFVTTSRFGTVTSEVAANNPDVRFFVFGVPSWAGNNVSGYVPRYHQAWYLAGVAFASFASGLPAEDSHRLRFGFVGALPNPEVITQLNAFTLGARSVSKEVTVDVVWLGGFVPPEGVVESALDYLIEDQNRFIINRIGARNTDLLDAIEAHNEAEPDNKVFGSVLDNADACQERGEYCLGGPAWNWGPLYTRLLTEMQRDTFDPSVPIRDALQSEPSQSVVNLALNDAQTGFTSALRDQLGETIGKLTDGGDNTFAPTNSNKVCPTDPDQRPGGCVSGRVEDAELDSMCWLVEGVVQRRDPNQPFEPGTNDLTVARTPEGELWPPSSFDVTPVSLTCN